MPYDDHQPRMHEPGSGFEKLHKELVEHLMRAQKRNPNPSRIEEYQRNYERWSRWMRELGFWCAASVIETIYIFLEYGIGELSKISLGLTCILIIAVCFLNKKRIAARNDLLISEVMES